MLVGCIVNVIVSVLVVMRVVCVFSVFVFFGDVLSVRMIWLFILSLVFFCVFCIMWIVLCVMFLVFSFGVVLVFSRMKLLDGMIVSVFFVG